MMGVGLYTSRLILEALGVVDFGLYSLVGGIVTMFSFLNSAMTSATQRYLAFDIGKGDKDHLQKTFNATLNIHILISLATLILAETIGLWFINNRLSIPPDRLAAANWVFQFSIFTFVLDVVQVPYNALIIAREHMKVFAYFSIGESMLKLGIVFIIIYSSSDRLILYGILLFCVAFITRLIYKIYCKRHFKESIYKFFFEKQYYKELLSYSGWSLFGGLASSSVGQGGNILLNLFFGPAINAAYGLTLTVQGVVNNFVSNFQMAVRPQIIINYSKGEGKASLELISLSAKFSYFIMLLIILPIIVNTDMLLRLWLIDVPDYTVPFVRLALIYTLIETISSPLVTGIQATGTIKRYQIIIGSFILMFIPISWLILKVTGYPTTVYYVLIAVGIISIFIRLSFIQRLMRERVNIFYKKVLLKIIVSTVPIVIILAFTKGVILERNNIILLIAKSTGIISLSVLSIYFCGTSTQERVFVKKVIKKIIHK